ncbi:hypothetical protein HN924_01770 [Candidatus Woesearchaeota archaeon]|jgi:hypothetical protein|nr:hypothetical protein [Candidatus Woesearchaeota archaeon]MBT7062677.1 hypothetical protein [Candidatus Woesearchaeota archaeon]MBT7402540.1 hypothetical protein [Candidatus Woesearchaeota archaeon]
MDLDYRLKYNGNFCSFNNCKSEVVLLLGIQTSRGKSYYCVPHAKQTIMQDRQIIKRKINLLNNSNPSAHVACIAVNVYFSLRNLLKENNRMLNLINANFEV